MKTHRKKGLRLILRQKRKCDMINCKLLFDPTVLSLRALTVHLFIGYLPLALIFDSQSNMPSLIFQKFTFCRYF